MSPELSTQQLKDIAKEFGTPVYVYHAERIKEQYEKLLSAFKGVDTKFFYAAKALTNINILKYILSIGCKPGLNQKTSFIPPTILRLKK
jgi:diaminopimelate decarboxylase